MKVRTFTADIYSYGTIVRGPSLSGLVVVLLDNGKRVVRHVDRVEALDDEARAALTKIGGDS